MPTQGASTPSSPASRLTRTPEGLIYTGTTLTYRITGLTAYNLDRLRVTLKAVTPDSPTVFHIDTVDLYNSRGRELFAEVLRQVPESADRGGHGRADADNRGPRSRADRHA